MGQSRHAPRHGAKFATPDRIREDPVLHAGHRHRRRAVVIRVPVRGDRGLAEEPVGQGEEGEEALRGFLDEGPVE